VDGICSFSHSGTLVFGFSLVRQPPQVPKLEIPEEIATTVAKSLTVEINRVLAVFQEITVGNDTKRFLRVTIVSSLSLSLPPVFTIVYALFSLFR
jgi:hypothetical protein